MTEEERREKIRERIQRNTAVSSYNNVVDHLSDNTQRVAFYTRVATPAPDQVLSFELQKKELMNRLERHPNWTLAGIYQDEGCSGKRIELNRMIEDCKAGKIDLILTKSISRISKNIDELLQFVNTLMELDQPVGVLFETENIYTLSNPERVQLELLGEYAQEESRIKSQRGGGGCRL